MSPQGPRDNFLKAFTAFKCVTTCLNDAEAGVCVCVEKKKEKDALRRGSPERNLSKSLIVTVCKGDRFKDRIQHRSTTVTERFCFSPPFDRCVSARLLSKASRETVLLPPRLLRCDEGERAHQNRCVSEKSVFMISKSCAHKPP